MAKVSVYNMEGNQVGDLELNDAVFGVEVNEHLVHLAVVNQLANNRQGTQKAKTVLRFPVAVENLGDRKEQVTQDRVLQELHSGKAAALYLLQSQEIILSK